MDSATKLFKTSALGFNRSDVINYIEKTRNDFYDYKIQTQRTIDDLNDKIKELEEALKSKENYIYESKPSDNVDFSSSVSQINEAADHLRETADKICVDIGDFLDKILTADRDIFTEEAIIEEESNDETIVTEDAAEPEFEIDTMGFLSQFSQIINNAFIEKEPEELIVEAPAKDSSSILDGLLGSSVFSE